MAETLVTSPEAREYLFESGFHQVSHARDLRSPQDDEWLQISPTWRYGTTAMEDLLSDGDHISAAQADAEYHAWVPEPSTGTATCETVLLTPGNGSAVSKHPPPELSGTSIQQGDFCGAKPAQGQSYTPTQRSSSRHGHRASAMKLLTTAANHVTKAFHTRKSRQDRPEDSVTDASRSPPVRTDTTLMEETATLASWEASNIIIDSEPTWLYHFRSGVSALSTVPGNGAFITPELNLEQRIRAHAIAALWGLSHMSVGKTRTKRLIIANCPITPFCGNGGQCVRAHEAEGASALGHQTPTRSGDKSDHLEGIHMDVTRICFHIDVRESADALLEDLNDQGCISAPLQHLYTSTTNHLGEKLVTAFCANVEISSRVVEELSAVRQLGRAHLLHVHYPFMDGEKSICEQRGASQATIHGLDQIWSSPTLGRSTHAAQQPPPRKRKLSSQVQRRSSLVRGFDSPSQRAPSSAASSMHSDHSMCSSTASTARKFRQPKVKNGYQCPDCVRMFDRAAERDKHWKNVHQKDRPYQCSSCAMAFLYPKDLERHLPVHGAV